MTNDRLAYESKGNVLLIIGPTLLAKNAWHKPPAGHCVSAPPKFSSKLLREILCYTYKV